LSSEAKAEESPFFCPERTSNNCILCFKNMDKEPQRNRYIVLLNVMRDTGLKCAEFAVPFIYIAKFAHKCFVIY
jgi:hypothetical protein